MKPVLLLCLTVMICHLGAGVVINEVCYDPTGSDDGHEWIELYNNGNYTVNLEGALIQAGGSSLTTICTLPYFLLRPGRYVLIGDVSVPQAVIQTELLLQNGGTETDAIRYVSPEGMLTDTVLYDSPNSNGITDDTGYTATEFAPDAPEGTSLARCLDGVDTDNCALDFQVESSPSPGLPNPRRVDYGFGAVQVTHPDEWWLSAVIINHSQIAPVLPALLTISYESVTNTIEIDPIAAGDSTYVELQLYPVGGADFQVLLELSLPADPDTTNNTFTIGQAVTQPGLPVINEVMYDPLTGTPEWLEIMVASLPSRTDYTVVDASGNDMSFSLPANVGYYILCSSATSFLVYYPSCPPERVIQTTGWVSLNNDGDSLILKGSGDETLDSMAYTGVTGKKGFSLERYLDDSDSVHWRYSLAQSGSTPAEENSQITQDIPEIDGTLKLTTDAFFPLQGGKLSLVYKFSVPSTNVNCRIYDLRGRKKRSLAERLNVGETGILEWDGRDDNGKVLPQGPYIILWESQTAGGGKIYRRQLEAALGH